MFSSEQMGAILTALPDPVFILTRSGRYAAMFGGSDARYYHDGSFLVGKRMDEVLHAEKAQWFAQQIAIALASRTLHIVEYGLAGSDVKGLESAGPQDTIWFEGRVQALDFPVEGEDAVLWVASNITASHALKAELRQQSETDALSGLPNRRKLMAALAEHYSVFSRYGTPTTVLVFDLDHFKRINDERGHLSGDRAIQHTAQVCRSVLRATDVPGRLGGDEFVVLMPHTTTEQAQPIVERLREELAQGEAMGPGTTLSGGLSQFLFGDHSSEDVLKRADVALYQAKRAGRNRIVALSTA